MSLDPENPVLIGRFDFGDAMRVLVNLVENAFKYTPATTPIELSVRRDGAWVAFAVADRGPGIAPAEVGRIFTPFYRPLGRGPRYWPERRVGPVDRAQSGRRARRLVGVQPAPGRRQRLHAARAAHRGHDT